MHTVFNALKNCIIGVSHNVYAVCGICISAERVLRHRRIQVKTLLIWGSNDGVLQTRLAHMSRDFVNDFTLNLIDGASHWVQQEEPERVNNAILKFLADYNPQRNN